MVGALSLTVRQNNFIYRVDKIKGVPVSGSAFRTDLTVGFAYGLEMALKGSRGAGEMAFFPSAPPPPCPPAGEVGLLGYFCRQISQTRCESSGTMSFSIARRTAPLEPGMQKIMVSR